jgi:hypothetical protein
VEDTGTCHEMGKGKRGSCLPPGAGDLDHRSGDTFTQQPAHCLVVGDDRRITRMKEGMVGVKMHGGDNYIIGPPERRSCVHNAFVPVHVYDIHGMATGGKLIPDHVGAMNGIKYQHIHKNVRGVPGLFLHF